MWALKQLMSDVLRSGEERDTRSGKTISSFGHQLKFEMDRGFPAVTSKKLAWKSVVGELLWFLSGKTDLSSLREYTFGEDKGQHTIWTDDCNRWNAQSHAMFDGEEHLGLLYGHQWRKFGGVVDQISNLIKNLREHPESRYQLVMAWDATVVDAGMTALPPCHIGFQCYVTAGGKLNLHWHQRSWDLFLGAPFNIASYALLLHLLARWTGYQPGTLSVWGGDVHVYAAHVGAVTEYIDRPVHPLPQLVLPDGTDTLEDTLKLTALDFSEALVGYVAENAIKAVLSVG